MARVAVIGAGAMGLAAAYWALRGRHEVDLYEAAPEPGGMAAHFDLAGLSIERFYHFVCKADASTFALLDELGIGDRMRWVPTSMGYFVNGRLYPWGDPVSLLRFPLLDLISKLRYGLLMFVSTRRARWDALEHVSARQWITRWCGAKVYDVLWSRLFELKFYELADAISAAWIWTRVKRLGRSRRSLLQEELGYIEGGSQTLVDALVAAIGRLGGRIYLGAPIERIEIANGRVTGIRTGGAFRAADVVISTVPTPHVSRMAPDLPGELRNAYNAIQNIGVICVLFRLKRSVTPNFWVNISDPEIPIPGIIEFSNLRPTGQGDTVVYVPYYMPVTNPKFRWSDRQLIDEAFAAIRRINTAISESDIVASYVGRLTHAQPICPPGFASRIPEWNTPVKGLMIADTCFYYPEDRGISESVRFGKMMAEALGEVVKITDRPFVRFVLTGGVAALVNLLARIALSQAMSYELAVALAYLIGMTTAFVLARAFVFDPGERSISGQYIRFGLVNVVALAQVWVVSVGLARFVFPAIDFHWHAETIAHAIGIVSPVVTSYFGHKYYSFR